MPDAAVECYAGYHYPERPRAFTWAGERVEIEIIERRWRTPASPLFRVRTTSRLTFHTLWYNTT